MARSTSPATRIACQREAFPVSKPGGRFAVSDIVVRVEMPADIQLSVAHCAVCVADALTESEYRGKLAQAGFDHIEVEPRRIYSTA
jgi:hypothetical protein